MSSKYNPEMTIRELEILKLLSDGLKDHQIAKKLFVEPTTIKTHVHNIYSKLSLDFEKGHKRVVAAQKYIQLKEQKLLKA